MNHRSWLAALALTSVVALASGCGADSAEDTVTPQDAPSPTTELTVEVTDGDTTTWQLSCDPAGGDHPDTTAACAALAENGAEAVPATPSDSMCTQLFGGEQTAVVTGTWQGKPVDATFSRQNGCEISRWDALAPLLPKVSA